MFASRQEVPVLRFGLPEALALRLNRSTGTSVKPNRNTATAATLRLSRERVNAARVDAIATLSLWSRVCRHAVEGGCSAYDRRCSPRRCFVPQARHRRKTTNQAG